MLIGLHIHCELIWNQWLNLEEKRQKSLSTIREIVYELIGFDRVEHTQSKQFLIAHQIESSDHKQMIWWFFFRWFWKFIHQIVFFRRFQIELDQIFIWDSLDNISPWFPYVCHTIDFKWFFFSLDTNNSQNFGQFFEFQNRFCLSGLAHRECCHWMNTFFPAPSGFSSSIFFSCLVAVTLVFVLAHWFYIFQAFFVCNEISDDLLIFSIFKEFIFLFR